MKKAMRRRQTILAVVSILSIGVTIGAHSVAIADEAVFLAKLEASRLTGPAPLAVMFDATGTQLDPPLDSFREVQYSLDFGDDRGLKWEHSGKPKNTQTGGPLAAHVFDLPGNYTVRLRATAPDGRTSDVSLVIAVEDPDRVYPGAKTVCVSPSGQYSGCPPKAARETRLPFSYGGKRVLLNRGETFGVVAINRNSDNVIIGSYGSGPKPAVSQVVINSGALNQRFADDLVVMDIAIMNGIAHQASGSRYLFYRNEMTLSGGVNSIDIGGALDYYAERHPEIQFYFPREIFIVENNIRGQAGNDEKPFINVALSGAYIALLGNDISRSQEHTVRMFAVHKGFVAHNAIRGISYGTGPDGSGVSIRHALKVHSAGILPFSDVWTPTNRKWATRHLVIANNQMGDVEDNGSFTVKIAPQNYDDGTIEGIEDVILEENTFSRGAHTNTEAQVVGRRVTTRGNVRADAGVPVLNVGRPSASFPPEWHGPYFLQ